MPPTHLQNEKGREQRQDRITSELNRTNIVFQDTLVFSLSNYHLSPRFGSVI